MCDIYIYFPFIGTFINRLQGPSRRMFKKPVIASVSGYAVAGGLELALMCDMRVAEESAIFGVFCRRFGRLKNYLVDYSRLT